MGVARLFSLEGRKALVTGGASGMGLAVAEGFAEMGADVAILDIDIDSARRAASKLQAAGVDGMALRADVTDPAAVTEAVEAAHRRFGRIDILFNNVGLSFNCPAEQMALEDFKRIVDLDLNAVFYVAQTVAKHMIADGGGSIINTASMSGHIVNVPQCQCGYNTAKAGVIQLTRSLAVEWARHNIRVNCISPGYMDTPMVAHVPEARRSIWRSMIPMGRMGLAEEVAGAAVYLASDAASYTTGCDIRVDGGYTCI